MRTSPAQIIPQVIPMVLGGLKRQMETQGGPARVDHILNKYGSEDVLGRIGEEMASRASNPTTDARLGGLLGDAGIQATDLMSQKFGLNASAAAKIIPMLAPLILGALSQRRTPRAEAGSGASRPCSTRTETAASWTMSRACSSRGRIAGRGRHPRRDPRRPSRKEALGSRESHPSRPAGRPSD